MKRAERNRWYWPDVCMKCGAGIGEFCKSPAGKRTLRHWIRAAKRILGNQPTRKQVQREKMLRRYSAPCPVCKQGRGSPCRNRSTGKAVHMHMARAEGLR